MAGTYRTSYVVKAPIDRVYAYLSDPRHAVAGSRPEAVTKVADTDSRFRVSGPTGDLLLEYQVLEPPHHLVGRTWSEDPRSRIDGVVEYTLATAPGGTRIQVETRLRLSGINSAGWHLARVLGVLHAQNRNLVAARTNAIETWVLANPAALDG
jgi:uncharacterized protein YndB with AHSA1/START domain